MQVYLCAHVYVCSVREPCLCTRACEVVFFRIFPYVTVHVWVCAHICVPSARVDSFTSTCVSVYTSVCAHVFMDTGMTVDWENPLELICASILVDENITCVTIIPPKSSSSSRESWPPQRHTGPQPGPPPPRSLPRPQTPHTHSELYHYPPTPHHGRFPTLMPCPHCSPANCNSANFPASVSYVFTPLCPLFLPYLRHLTSCCALGTVSLVSLLPAGPFRQPL